MTGKESDSHYLGLTASEMVKHLLSYFDKFDLIVSFDSDKVFNTIVRFIKYYIWILI